MQISGDGFPIRDPSQPDPRSSNFVVLNFPRPNRLLFDSAKCNIVRSRSGLLIPISSYVILKPRRKTFTLVPRVAQYKQALGKLSLTSRMIGKFPEPRRRRVDGNPIPVTKSVDIGANFSLPPTAAPPPRRDIAVISSAIGACDKFDRDGE